MADIQAFHGVRYDLARVGSLSDVVAPPYDAIDSQLQTTLYDCHPNNIVRLILNRGDQLHGNASIYDDSAKRYKTWIRDGILKADTHPTVYVYHQTFRFESVPYTRRGFIARVGLEPFGEGSIYPHEQTHSSVKKDRFDLMVACRANLSQIFGIYPDADNEAQQILEDAIADRTPLQATDHLGVEHAMWMVEDSAAIASAAAIMGTMPIYIADGHHRYETACDVQRHFSATESTHNGDAVNYVSMMCVSMHDPGMVILPTHRLFRGLPETGSEDLRQRLNPAFDCELGGESPQAAGELWQLIADENQQSTMAFYCRADDKWVLARLNQTGEQMMKQLAPQQSVDWRSLGVAILHRLAIDDRLRVAGHPSPKYVHAIDDVVDGLTKGDTAGRDATGQMGSGRPFELGCLVMPATLEHVKSISHHGERMPAKSTYFFPKLLSGLVINPLE